MKKIVGTKLFKHLLVLTSYLWGIWFIQLLATSFLTFFHLALNHPLGIIEQWLFVDAPLLIIFSKMLSGFICILFVQSYLSSKHPLKECLQQHKSILKQADFLPMIFWFILLLIIGRASLSTFLNFNFSSMAWSYLGNVVFWVSDLVVLFVLNFVYPLKDFQKWFVAIFLGLATSLLFKVIYPYAAHYDYFYFFTWCAIICFSYCKSYFYQTNSGQISLTQMSSFIRPFVFIISVIAPAAAIFGADVIWGRDFSYFILDVKKLWPIGLSGILILSIYFNWWYQLYFNARNSLKIWHSLSLPLK